MDELIEYLNKRLAFFKAEEIVSTEIINKSNISSLSSIQERNTFIKNEIRSSLIVGNIGSIEEILKEAHKIKEKFQNEKNIYNE